MHDARRFAKEHSRIALRVQLILHFRDARRLGVGNKGHGPLGFAYASIAAVLRYADNRIRTLGVIEIRDLVSEWIDTLQVAVGKGLVDDGDSGGGRSIGIGEIAALPQRDTHGAQEI